MAEKKQNYWTLDRVMWLLIGLAITAGVIWLMYYLRDALLPFFVACLIAYILQPLVDFNMRWCHIHNRTVVSVLTLLAVTAVLAGILWLTIPSIISELGRFEDIIHDISTGKIQLPHEYDAILTFLGRHFNPSNIIRMLDNVRIESIVSKGSSLLYESTQVILHTVSWMLTIIYVLFILIDYKEIKSGFKQIVPQRYRPQAIEIFNNMANGMNHYFRGQGKVALCAMVLYCTGFLIIGLPMGIAMGIIVGILYMIPYFQYITLIPVAGICIVVSLGGGDPFWVLFGKSLLVYVVSQCICDYVITPRVMGKELGLTPAIILLSLSVWGSLLGIIGMIIALPVTVFIMQYYQTYISNRK